MGIPPGPLPQSPNSEPVIWHGDGQHFVSAEHIRQVSLFVFLYMITRCVGSLIIAVHGYDLDGSLFEFASSLGPIGLDCWYTGPDAPIGGMWTQIAGMILRRFEFFAVIYGVTKLLRDGFNFVWSE